MRYTILGGALLSVVLLGGCSDRKAPASPAQTSRGFCKPGQACWPAAADWKQLQSGLTGRFEQPQSPLQPCRADADGEACANVMRDIKNPVAIQDLVGGTQSMGWLDAWEAEPSAYAVVAKDAQDIVAAVDFARAHRLRLVVKGTGHDYLGRSNAADSLLVWTHEMRKVTSIDSFVGNGCPASQPGVPAVTVEAGSRWLDAYQEVTVKNHRYVQGGGCTTVGAAGGFLQGGGFGSWSKQYGTAASNMLEAHVVTADGRLLIANACQNQDLFWALRGGGGGTFGVVTQATLRTHPLPTHLGFLRGSITAKSEAAFAELLERFVALYREQLNNEHWGEQIHVDSDNALGLAMSFTGISASEAEAAWQPLLAWVHERPQVYTVTTNFIEVPPQKMWDHEFIGQNFPAAIVRDQREGQTHGNFWWAGDGEQVATYWYAYQSRWIPLALFDKPHEKSLAAVLFQASRHWEVGLHFNKGLAGASADAVRRGRETSTNPTVYDAAALAIIAASSDGYPGVPGREPNRVEGEEQRAHVTAAMRIVRDATPGAGAYVNEADYFEPDWQRSFWGENYPKLAQIKRKYDPDGLFTCHHCVGSE
jgi:FAD/FMN-containing dehydrogenase